MERSLIWGLTLFMSVAFCFSVQGQSTWFPLPLDLLQGSVQSIDYEDGYLLTTSVNAGIFRSSDQGFSWERMDSGLGLMGGYTNSIGHNDSFWFTGTNDGLYRSADQGEFWELADSGLPASSSITYVRRVYQFDSSTFSLFTDGSIFYSDNNGESWEPSDSGIIAGTIANELTMVDSALFLGSDKGLFRSFDLGRSWTALPGPTLNEFIPTLMGVGARLMVLDSGVYYSDDLGSTWHSTTGGPAAFIAFKEGNFVQGGLDSLFLLYQGSGIFLSPDNGLSWIDQTGTLASGLFTIYQMTYGGGTPFVTDIATGVHKGDIFTHQTLLSAQPGFEINIWPHPFHEHFTLRIDAQNPAGIQCEIIDLKGRILKRVTSTQEETAISISDLSPGIYLLRVTEMSSGKTTIKKVIAY